MPTAYRRDDLRGEFVQLLQPYVEEGEGFDAAQGRYERWFHALNAIEDAELERVADSVWYEFGDCDPALAAGADDPEWIPQDELRRRVRLYMEVLQARWPDPPPQERVEEGFVLRPLTVGDNDMDFDAVVGAREFLRRWAGRGWPADGFDLVQNRDDLERHELEHRDGVALTYTVLGPSRTECLGCVYVHRLRRLLIAWNRPEVDVVHSGDEQAAVSFWVRPGRKDLGPPLMDVLKQWPAERPFFHTNENCPEQVALFEESGLERRLAARVEGVRGRVLLFR